MNNFKRKVAVSIVSICTLTSQMLPGLTAFADGTGTFKLSMEGATLSEAEKTGTVKLNVDENTGINGAALVVTCDDGIVIDKAEFTGLFDPDDVEYRLRSGGETGEKVSSGADTVVINWSYKKDDDTKGLVATFTVRAKEGTAAGDYKVSVDLLKNNDKNVTSKNNDSVVTNMSGDGVVVGKVTVAGASSSKSTDATLKSFKAGSEAITTVADKYDYEVTVPYGTTTVPEITDIVKNDSKAGEPVVTNATSFTDGKATSTIVVTAEDGTTKKTYNVTYKVAEQTKISDVIESVSISTDATVGKTLTANITYKTGHSKEELGNIDYVWNGITGTANGDSYTVVAGDVDKKISVTVKGDKVAGEVKSNEVTAGKSKPAAPASLELKADKNGDNTVVTATVPNPTGELEYNFRVNSYATAQTPDQWTDWKSTNTYNEGKPGDTVYAFARYKATGSSEASDYVTASVKIKNNKAEFASIGPAGTDAVMTPGFSTAVTEYEVKVPYGASVQAYPLQYQIGTDSLGATVTPDSLSFTTFGKHDVTITSEDGSVTKTYSFNYVEAKRALADLHVDFNGDTEPQQITFNAATKEYNVVLPETATDETVKNYKLEWTLNEGATVKDSRIQATGLAEGVNKTYVTVTCDGIDTTYTVTFTKKPVVLSSDATLKSLTVQGYAVAFVPTQTKYTVVLPAGTKYAPAVTGIVNDANAKIINIVPGGAIINGTATSSITVQAQDGSLNTYYVVFTSATLSSDTTLSSIVPTTGTLSPSFSPYVETYTVVLPTGTSYVPAINYIKNDSNQIVKITSAANINGTTYVTVTAPSGTATRTYRITFRVSGSTVDSGTITVQPTCTNTGTRVYRDTATGQIVRTETISALGHNWDSGVVVTQPTATTTGTRKYTCLRCGEVKYETIPATGVTTYTYYNYSTPVTSRVNYIEPSSNGIDASRTNVAGLPSVDIDRLTSVKFNYKGKGSYTLKWSRVVGVTNYEVYVGKNGDLKKVKDTSSTSVGLKGLKNNTSYDVQIKFMYDGVQHTINGSTFVYYKPAVRAEATSNAVTLRWNPVEGAEKYAIYQVVNGKYKKVAETTKSSVKIGKRKANTEYKYAVRAYVDGSWTGIAKSDVVTIKTSKK